MFAGAVVGNKIYVIGGLSLNGTSLVYGGAMAYDVTTDTWTTVVNGNPYAAQYATASTIGNTIYLVGGADNTGSLNKAYKGTVGPAGINWTKIASYPVIISRAASGVLNGKLFVAGGVEGDASDKTYYYDPAKSAWTFSYALPLATYNVPKLETDGSALYYIGGYLNNNTLKLTLGAELPEAVISQTQFSLAVQKGSSRSFNLPIYNKGVADLTAAMNIPGTPWMTATPPNVTVTPGTSQSLSVKVDAATLNAGSYTATASITTNDANHATTPITVKVYVVDKLTLAPNQVVMEESSGSWCGPCGAIGVPLVRQLEETYGEKLIVLGYHDHGGRPDEPMATTETESLDGALGVGFFPSAGFNRNQFPSFLSAESAL